MESSFPRGGRKSLEPNENNDEKKRKRSKSLEPIKTDFLFGEKETHKATSKRRKKAQPVSSPSVLPHGGGAVVHPAKGEPYIEALSFSRLSKNMRLLGCVRDVQKDLVVFSLPNLWTGYMIAENCEGMVSVGQYLSVVIVKTAQESTSEGPKKRIQVDCRPTAANNNELSVNEQARAQVISVEDHGVLMDLGRGRRGFLPFETIEGEFTLDSEVTVGQDTHVITPGRIFDVMVTGNDKILPLSLHSRQTVARQYLSASTSLSSLQPGSLVRTSVDAVVRNGLCVTFCRVFRGAIESSHLGGTWPTSSKEVPEWKAVFRKHTLLSARIVAVDATSKIVRLSLLPHLLDLVPPPEFPSVGTVVEDATVVRIDPGLGALLALPNLLEEKRSTLKRINRELWEDESYQKAARFQTVYVHISKAVDENTRKNKASDSSFTKRFPLLSMHSVRIMSSSNWIDGIASGATADSIITAHVLTHADLLPGKVFRQVPICAHVNNGGVLVDFGMGVRGLIPPVHLFDQAVSTEKCKKLVEELYAVQKNVDVRVLSVDTESKRAILTAKKYLIKCSDIISSYADVRVGQQATGFVSKVDDVGLSVTFFNGVYGKVTARSLLVELGVENHKDNYQVGDVVQCRVVNVKKRVRRSGRFDVEDEMPSDDDEEHRGYKEITLSLKMKTYEPDDGFTGSKAMTKSICIRAGVVLPQRCLRIIELLKGKAKEDGFVPGYAIVSVKSKYLVDNISQVVNIPPFIECKLPFDQILDDYEPADTKSASALDSLAEKLLTVGKKINRKSLILTDPAKAPSEYSAGTGKLITLSIRPKLVEFAEAQLTTDNETPQDWILPGPGSHLYVGAHLIGYVAQVDHRYGSFVRFLNGMTGLVPKSQGGLELPLFGTVKVRIVALDVTCHPAKILLAWKKTFSKSNAVEKLRSTYSDHRQALQVGDVIEEAEITKLDFHRAAVKILDSKWALPKSLRARLHVTMAESHALSAPVADSSIGAGKLSISMYHPFHMLELNSRLTNLKVVAIDSRDGIDYVELSNRTGALMQDHVPDTFIHDISQLLPGQKVSGIVVAADQKKGGLWLQLSPGITGFIPGLELSNDANVLNNMRRYFPDGCRLECTVMDKTSLLKTRAKYLHSRSKKSTASAHGSVFLSFLQDAENYTDGKPSPGSTLVGRINRSLPMSGPPSLMLELRNGFIGRCCICELDEPDDWKNMPLGHLHLSSTADKDKTDDYDYDR